MAERVLPGLKLRGFYDAGQRNWGTPLSEDLRRLSALVQPRAASRTSALPTAPSADQQIRIVPAGAAQNANSLALWDVVGTAPAWVFLSPEEGWQIWVADEARFVRFTAGAWVDEPPYGVARLRTLTGTTHTLQAADCGAIIEATGTSTVTITIPTDTAVPFALGTLIHITQIGGGTAKVQAAAGVTLNGITGGSVDLAGQWSGAVLTKRGANAWIIQGALAGSVA
jgi:hypothetical protein